MGGGCGSAAEAALARLGGRVARWRFTELVPTFARRGERAARAAAGAATRVEAGRLDMTKPWETQGVLPGSFDAVYSVNCFHVAPDLGFVLAEAKAALRPAGVVVVSECVKPGAHPPPSYVDFVFDFLASFTDVKTDPVLRPNHGFLSPAAWRASFAAAGFRGVEVLPGRRRRRGAVSEVLRRRDRRAPLRGRAHFFFVSAGRREPRATNVATSSTTCRSTCPAFSYSSGVEGPSPATKR